MRSAFKHPFNCPACWSNRVQLIAGWYRECLGRARIANTKEEALAILRKIATAK